jgi:hypothetical protein
MNRLLRPFLLTLLALFILNLTSCEKPQSLVKVFVRDASGNLVGDVEVKIISSTNSDPATAKHSDKLRTNTSGFCTFNLDTFFAAQIATSRDGYFDIVVDKDQFSGLGSVRATYQTTQVQTVKFSITN